MTDRLLVIGGDAGGMGAATQARRLKRDLEIVALEKGTWTSYSACGIPYVVGGVVDDLDDLVVRRPAEFAVHDIEVRTGHEVMALDLDARQAEVRDHAAGATYRIGFDVLHIGTGATPVRPPLPGITGNNIVGVQSLVDAEALLVRATSDAKRVVVVGGGYIGLEMAEAFIERGATSVTVVDGGEQLMSTLDPDMAQLVTEALQKKGVVVELGRRVTGFDDDGVHTEAGLLPADLVVLGIGVAPNSTLAVAAGIEAGARGAIRVDRSQRTSADGVYAAGDCCESFHLVAERPVHIALGTIANKQARVAGINIGGGYATFPGVVGTAVTKLCATEVARTGLSEKEARQYGFTAVAAMTESSTRAGYFPGAGWIKVKLVAEKGTGRVLGGQIVGLEGAAKRIDVVAAAVTARFDVEQILGLDLSYAPPFGPVWDPIQAAARKLLPLVTA